MKAWAALATVTILATGCAGILTKSDNVLVGDSLAARIYYLDRYTQMCPHDAMKYLPAAAPECLNLGLLLGSGEGDKATGWLRANNVATKVIAEGALPAPEKKELKDYRAAVEKLVPTP